MTPQLFVKLTSQIARQTPELADYESEIADRNIKSLNLQPAIDAAQADLDALADGADKTEAQTALDAAKAPQTKINSERDELTSRANALKAAIAQCQAEIDASGLTMTQGEIDAIQNAPVVPKAVTMRQARLALLGAGVLAGVDAAIDAMSEPTRSAARIEWEYSGEVQRHNGFVAALGPALGMTGEQIDALFIAAATYQS